VTNEYWLILGGRHRALSGPSAARRRRLRGFAAQAFLLACQILGSNLRKIETFMLKRLSQTPPQAPAIAKPRRHKTTPDVRRYAPNPNGPPLAEPA
jgi:hypothetical protein